MQAEKGVAGHALRIDVPLEVVLVQLGDTACMVRHGSPEQAGRLVDLLPVAPTAKVPARPVREQSPRGLIMAGWRGIPAPLRRLPA